MELSEEKIRELKLVKLFYECCQEYNQNIAKRGIHEDGEFYKVITAYGKTFEIRYGYYDEKDRLNPEIHPCLIYPDFLENPEYTEDGTPFVTAMQDRCEHYKLAERYKEHEDNGCYECIHYEKCDDLIAVCRCPKRKET